MNLGWNSWNLSVEMKCVSSNQTHIWDYNAIIWWSNSIDICTVSAEWRAHFTNNFSTAIQIPWKFHFALMQISMNWLLENFAHYMAAVLWCHVKKIVAIWVPYIEWQPNKISIKIWSQIGKSLVKWVSAWCVVWKGSCEKLVSLRWQAISVCKYS